jgi:hypothetical protein
VLVLVAVSNVVEVDNEMEDVFEDVEIVPDEVIADEKVLVVVY